LESISKFVGNVFYLVTNDPVALLSLIENGPTFVFIGLVTFGGAIAPTKNGLPPVFVVLHPLVVLLFQLKLVQLLSWLI
jgi:hypothetical protein